MIFLIAPLVVSSPLARSTMLLPRYLRGRSVSWFLLFILLSIIILIVNIFLLTNMLIICLT